MDRNQVDLSARRVAANAVDLLAAGALGVVLANTGVGFFFATRAVVMLRIGAPDTIWKGPIPMIMGIMGTFVYTMPFAILVVQLLEPLTRTPPSKALVGLSIGSSGGAGVSRAQLWSRAMIRATPWWGLTIALLAGSWVLALIFSTVGVLMLGNFLLSLFTPIRPVDDTWSGTIVVRIGRPTA
jgi:hypothetical protein